MSPAGKLRLLLAYQRAHWLDHLHARPRIEAIQRRWLSQLQRFVARRSPFYARYAAAPWMDWPVVDKAAWMEHFDTINTVGARLAEVSAIALEAERTRDFSKGWGHYTVGLSTGTSGNRGLFLASPAECSAWAGTLLGKLLGEGLLRRERIALILRAGATLYEAIAAFRLEFRFFDQATPWEALTRDLSRFEPTILVAPASVLRLLAGSSLTLEPRRVISVAEVLEPLDREHIERRFRLRVEQIYQATEGLLGVSCEEGTVHLNEPYVLFEPEWHDPGRTRFVPVITDLRRRAQPVIRYRLNDVLQIRGERCSCGRAALALSAIAGRTDDVLWLEGSGGAVPVFPDLLARAVVTALPEVTDYEIEELSPGHWSMAVSPIEVAVAEERLRSAFAVLAARLGAIPARLTVTNLFRGREPGSGKQRRIRGARPKCGS